MQANGLVIRGFRAAMVVFIGLGLTVGARADEAPLGTSGGREFPFTGIVVKPHAELRAGASGTYYVVGKLTKDQLVQVDEIIYRWNKVVPPAGSFSVVSDKAVDVDADGKTGVINRDRTAVKAGNLSRPDLADESWRIQINLMRGDKVTLLGKTSDGGYKIVPPPGAYVYAEPGVIEKATPAQIAAIQAAADEAAEKAAPKTEDVPAPPDSATAEPAPITAASKPGSAQANAAARDIALPANQPATVSPDKPAVEAKPKPAAPAAAKVTQPQPAKPQPVETVQVPAAPQPEPAPVASTPPAPAEAAEPDVPVTKVPDKDLVYTEVVEVPVNEAFIEPATPTTQADTPVTEATASTSPAVDSRPTPITEVAEPTQDVTDLDAVDSPPPAPAAAQPEPRSASLMALEAQFAQASKQPLEQQPLPMLVAGYGDLASDMSLSAIDRQLARQRLAQLDTRVRALAALRQAQAAQLTEEQHASRVQQRVELGASPYDAVGQLIASTVYDGRDDMPRLYRLVEPSGRRTLAYVQLDSGINVRQTLGRLVGVVGQSRMDATLKRPILFARRVEVLSSTQP